MLRVTCGADRQASAGGLEMASHAKAAGHHKGFDIIRNEHRALAAVVHCFEHLLNEVRDHSLDPPFDAFELLLRYLAEFPDRFHHPKEDDYLFPAVAQRDPKAAALIGELQEQHENVVRMTKALRDALSDWQADPENGFAKFEAAARDYVTLQWEHMRLEETEILPVARAKLTETDWEAIDQAFGENEDPIFGDNPKGEFDRLFSQIVASAPAPWGLGARDEPKRKTLLERIGLVSD